MISAGQREPWSKIHSSEFDRRERRHVNQRGRCCGRRRRRDHVPHGAAETVHRHGSPSFSRLPARGVKFLASAVRARRQAGGREYRMESFCSAGRRESSTWALLVRPIELIGHRFHSTFRGSDWASTTWALRHRDMLRVCARAAASDEMSGHIVSERDNISGGNLLAWQFEP